MAHGLGSQRFILPVPQQDERWRIWLAQFIMLYLGRLPTEGEPHVGTFRSVGGAPFLLSP